MRKPVFVLAVLLVMFSGALIASAHGHNSNSNGQQNSYGNDRGHSSIHSGPGASDSGGGSVSAPPVTPPTPPVVTGSQITITNAYTTAYGWPDNTPAGANTTIAGVSGTAGGAGTFANPITMATGFSLAGGKETDDYAAGTKFYDPNLRKYFVIGDTCGDGNSPQTEACHKSDIAGTVQLDMWVGGQGANTNSVLACEDAVTRVGTLIENPATNYTVVSGPVYNNGCAQQFGDTAVVQ